MFYIRNFKKLSEVFRVVNNYIQRLIRPLHIIPKRHSKYLIGLAMLGYAVYI